MKVLITGGSGFIGTNIHEFIGTHYPNYQLINVDIVKPKVNFSHSAWEECDILNKEKLESIFEKHQPNCVIHFAAETSCEPNLVLKDYEVNTQGSQNVFEIASNTKSVKTLIHTSTQFVNQYDFPLKDFFAYRPHTVYGESKIVSEKLLLENKYEFNWIIVRPTNVWGKWHLRYPQEFWKVLYEGKYIHPNNRGVVRSYGYVENICEQVIHFISNAEKLNGEVFYVGDEPVALYDWVNAFSLALKGREVRTVPKQLVYLLGLIGDVLKFFGIKFPITTSRYRSMTTSNPAPMEKTFKEVGNPKVSLQEGVNKTSEWLKVEIYD